MEYEIVYYKDNTSQVIESDLDLLNSVELTDRSIHHNEECKSNLNANNNFIHYIIIFKTHLKQLQLDLICHRLVMLQWL
jgi:hypothetical protein